MEKNTFYIQDDVLKKNDQDRFGHQHVAGAVVNSIISTNSPFIIGIFGGWGTGKSSLLRLIENKLPKCKIETVTIDAWRYTSAENLQRAFLVHIAKEKAEDLLDGLRRKLYSSEQETVLPKKSELDNLEIPTKTQLWKIILSFSYSAGLFLFFVLIIFSIQSIAENGFKEFLLNIDWVNYFVYFKDKIFIPLTLFLLNYLRIYVLQRPVTVSHERIDADELFAEYFDMVVEKVTHNHGFKNKKLVIFVDNLDRLTDEKMVEALESLKTYLDNENCIFVVACDDTIVRSVISKSTKIPKIKKDGDKFNGYKIGEHYLDKFFQQTFRLPEHMALNLQDFAEINFSKTILNEKLIKEKIDIRRLISIILPSDVSSPRKVKRLLNDFIALYDIVERREKKGEGQLRPGVITSEPEFLGKFSTIRTEYPEFYKLLIEDTSILHTITKLIKENKTSGEIKSLLVEIERQTNIESLVAYLRKTRTTMVEDLGLYIFLSQDNLSLGLRGEHIRVLENSLSDGDIEEFKNLFNSSDSEEYQNLICKVASRLVEQRFVALPQENGAKILSSMLPLINETLRPEIAHIISKLFPELSMDIFESEELLNVLKWANRESDAQKNLIGDHLLSRLNIEESRQLTFEAILKNGNLIEERNYTMRVQNWLQNILGIENQALFPTPDIEGKEVEDTNKFNREFAELLITKFEEYSTYEKALEYYLSGSPVEYMVRRLIGEFEGSSPVVLGADGIGNSIEVGLNRIFQFAEMGGLSPQFWEGLIIMLSVTGDIKDYLYSSEKIKKLINLVPENMCVEIINALLIGINFVVAELEEEDVPQWLTGELNLIADLRRRLESELLEEEANEISQNYSTILNSKIYLNTHFAFSETYNDEFNEEYYPFITGIVNSFPTLGINAENGLLSLETMQRQNKEITQSQRESIAKAINSWVLSNTDEQIKNASIYISLISSTNEYQSILEEHSEHWLNIVKDEAIPLFFSKINLILILIKNKFILADSFLEKLIPLIPFGGDQNKLKFVIDNMVKIRELFSIDKGKDLFNAFLAHIGSIGGQEIQVLNFISLWIDEVDDNSKLAFSSHVHSHFQKSPKLSLTILTNIWQVLTEKEIIRHLEQIYSITPDNDYKLMRGQTINKAIEKIDKSRLPQVIIFIWDSLITLNLQAEEFLSDAIISIKIDDLLRIRENIIGEVREDGASEKSNKNLKFLVQTVRDDVRDMMLVVDLFVNLFGRGEDDINLAVDYVFSALKSFGIRSNHKHKLAESMGKATFRSSEEISKIIHREGGKLGLKRYPYRKYWKKIT